MGRAPGLPRVPGIGSGGGSSPGVGGPQGLLRSRMVSASRGRGLPPRWAHRGRQGGVKARIVVRLRPGILDPQGTTIRRALEGLGFPEVRDMRVGKILDLTLDETDAGRARQRLDEMCRKLLANPVIEDYTCEVVDIDDGRRAS